MKITARPSAAIAAVNESCICSVWPRIENR